MSRDSKIVDRFEMEGIYARASVLMKRGIRLMQESDANLEAALECFERALEFRRCLRTDVPVHAYDLSACLLNRAEALTRLGTANQRALALDAYDEAIGLLEWLPLSADPRYVRRLAVAHQNRGLTLSVHRPATQDAAMAFYEAIRVLEGEDAAPLADRTYLLAAVWMNFANTQASQNLAGADAIAREAAGRALTLVAATEVEKIDAAEIGLKARHILCRTIGRQLSVPRDSEGLPEEVHEATDVAEDGLSLVRHWEQRSVSSFRDLAQDLFRFAAVVYERYQPHFLDEFLAEHRDMHLEAVLLPRPSVPTA